MYRMAVNGNEVSRENVISRKRSTLSQVLAAGAQHNVLLAIGMAVGYLTILIPPLTNPESNEFIVLNESEVSWICTVSPLASFIGGILSGVTTEPFGRKRSMMFATILIFSSMITFYFINQLWHIFALLTVLGLIMGIVQAPVLAYIAEVTEPQLRGILTSSSVLVLTFGVFLEFLLGSVFDWRLTALMSGIAPLTAFFWLNATPETPYWLLSRNKFGEARQSLAWLRGWTDFENVDTEFREIQESFNKNTNVDDHDAATSFTDKYLRQHFLWPFGLVSFLFAVSAFSGLLTIPTFAVIIFSTLRVPINEYNATVLLGLAQFLGCVLCVTLVKYLGKKALGILSVIGMCICNVFIGVYAFSNDINTLDFNTSDKLSSEIQYNWTPLLLIVALAFIGHSGIRNLPYMLSGEVFSNETRSVGCGLSISVFFISCIVSVLYFTSIILALTLPGLFWAYACVCAIGLVVIILALPETEGKTLEEVRNYFTGRRNITTSAE